MKQWTLLAAVAAIIIGASATAGAVRANEIAAKAVETVQAEPQDEVTVATLNEVTTAEVQVMIDTTPGLVLVDTRAADAFATGHISGAHQIRPDDITAEKLAEFGATDKNTPMIFYCTDSQCLASAKGAHKAAEFGYTNLYRYTEGLAAWKAAGLPVAN